MSSKESNVGKEQINKTFTIHDLPVSERLRERFLQHGPEVLSLQEILALILGRDVSGDSEVSKGSLDSNIVHPREVFKEAIFASTTSSIFVHNHPFGNPTPSQDDIQLTKRLKEAGEIIGIMY